MEEDAVLAAFPNVADLRALSDGSLWRDASFLRAQLRREVEPRADETSLTLFLKAFAGNPIVMDLLIGELSAEWGAAAYVVLVNYYAYIPAPEVGLKIRIRDRGDAILVANAALRLAVTTGNSRHVEAAKPCALLFDERRIEKCIDSVVAQIGVIDEEHSAG